MNNGRYAGVDRYGFDLWERPDVSKHSPRTGAGEKEVVTFVILYIVVEIEAWGFWEEEVSVAEVSLGNVLS